MLWESELYSTKKLNYYCSNFLGLKGNPYKSMNPMDIAVKISFKFNKINVNYTMISLALRVSIKFVLCITRYIFIQITLLIIYKHKRHWYLCIQYVPTCRY